MRLTTIIIASLALASSAFGAIGETPAQFETGKPRTVKKLDGGSLAATWIGKRITHFGGFAPIQGIMRCEIETFWFNDQHSMTDAEMAKFMAPYQAFTIGATATTRTDSYLQLEDRNGDIFGMIIYEGKSNAMSFMTRAVWQRCYEAKAIANGAYFANTRRSIAPAPPAAPRTAPQPPQAPADPTGLPNDCLIIATQAYAKLKDTSYWCRIAGFAMNENGEYVSGHAVCLYQPTAGSNVWIYDESGSKELATKSHELIDLEVALNLKFRSGASASNMRFVER